MKTSHHSLPQKNDSNVRTYLAAGLMAFAGSAMAQPVFVTPADTTGKVAESLRSPDADSAATDSETDGIPLVGGSTPAGTPFQWRKISFRPHLSYSFTYGNGILSQTNREEKTIVQVISLGMAMEIGDHWRFDYTPSYSMYSDDAFEDSLGHSLSLSGHTSYEDWSFGVNFGMGISSTPTTETAEQTDQKSYSTSFNASRQLNGDLSMDLNASVSIQTANRFAGSRNYSTLNWLNQQFGPNIGAGLGVGFGYTDATASDIAAASGNTDSTYQQLLVRLIVHMTEKINLSINAGPEFRQYIDSDQSTLITPTYGVTLAYQLFEPTTLSLSGSRSVSQSFYQNQLTVSTSISASLSQRLFGQYSLGISGGYSFTEYEASQTSAETGREDSGTFFSVSIGRPIFKRGSISASYSINDNSSREEGFSYTSNQVGVQFSYAY